MDKIIQASTPVVMLTVEQLRSLITESLASYFDIKSESKQLLHGIPALAKALGMSLSRTKKLVASGDIPFIKVSTRKVIFDLDAVLESLQKGANRMEEGNNGK